MILDEKIKRELIRTAKDFDLDYLILFGSRARGDCFERSDIDLASSFVSASKYFDFCDEIEKIHTPLMFDVINLASSHIDLDLRKSIRDEGVFLYEKI